MRQRLSKERSVDHVADDRRFRRRQTAHVLRDTPQLFVAEELLYQAVAERRHWRAVQTGAQAVIDVFDRAAAVEAPILVQIRREDGMAGVVLERRRRRPVAAAQISVAFPASNRVVELPADLQ